MVATTRYERAPYLTDPMLRANFMLMLIIVLQIPWGSVDFCVAHPLGEPHHDGLSNCEKRAMWHGDAAVWPPMHCLKFAMPTDAYVGIDPIMIERPLDELSTPLPSLLIADLSAIDQEFVDPPVPRCRSHPLLVAYALRGPPLRV